MGVAIFKKVNMAVVSNPDPGTVLIGVDVDGITKQKDSSGNITLLTEPASRSTMIFDIIDLSILVPPPTGTMMLGIDLDGNLKKKDENGFIATIGGGNLSSVLTLGNDATGQSIKNLASLNSNTNQVIVDISLGRLNRTDGTTIIDWQDLAMYDSSGNTVVLLDSQQLLDQTGILSLRWSTRTAVDSSGTVAMRWDANRALYDGSGDVAFAWDNRIITKTGGVTVFDGQNQELISPGVGRTVNWKFGVLFSQSGVASLDWDNRRAYNAAGSQTIVYDSNCVLVDNAGQFSVRWDTRFAQDENGAISMFWSTDRKLVDPFGGNSIVWRDRTLYASNGSTIMMDWSNPTKIVQFNTSFSGTVSMANLPTSTLGLSIGDLWNNNGNVETLVDTPPTYTIATMGLTKSSATQDEVGTAYSNTLTATFTQNDAGSLTNIRIQKNGSDILPNGSSSPFGKVDSGSYVLGNITYTAYADYNAGIIKNYTPSGNPDARTPLVRNVNAPQAAESNFSSNTLVLTGLYKIFYGPSASAPGDSASVRALGSNRFTNAGNVFNLNTGSTQNIFTVAMPATMSLVSVIDLDALNADITANYVMTTFTVNDAGGTPVSFKIYTMISAVPYASNHRHQITIS